MFRNGYRTSVRPRVEALEDRIVPQAGQLSFFTPDFIVAENAGLAQVSVVRSGGSDGTVTVDFATHDESARAGVNYTATSGTLSFGPGETTKFIRVPILSDGQLAGNTAFGLELHNPGGGATLVDLQSAADVTIVDHDGSADQRFVNNVFLQLLHRAADPVGLAAFTGALAQGQTHEQVVLTIESSPEAHRVVVQDLYINLLGREAEPFGLGVFTTALQNGATVEQVKANLLGSDEYFLHSGGDNQSWLESVYQDVLHRLPDPFGEGIYLQALATGASRVQIAQIILTSPEAYMDQVLDYYKNFLNRTADAAGLQTWVTALQQGVRDEKVIAGFLGSPEYVALN
jgi:hypothetical protein